MLGQNGPEIPTMRLPPLRLALQGLIIAGVTMIGCIPLDDTFEGASSSTSKSWPVGAMPSVRIDAFEGGIWVRPGRDGEVRAVVTGNSLCKNLSHRTAEEALAFIEVEMTRSADTVSIFTRPKMGGPAGCGRSTSVEVWVPAGARLDLRTGVGSIHVVGEPLHVRAFNRMGAALFEVGGPGPNESGGRGRLVLEGWGGLVEIERDQGGYSYTGDVKPRASSRSE